MGRAVVFKSVVLLLLFAWICLSSQQQTQGSVQFLAAQGMNSHNCITYNNLAETNSTIEYFNENIIVDVTLGLACIPVLENAVYKLLCVTEEGFITYSFDLYYEYNPYLNGETGLQFTYQSSKYNLIMLADDGNSKYIQSFNLQTGEQNYQLEEPKYTYYPWATNDALDIFYYIVFVDSDEYQVYAMNCSTGETISQSPVIPVILGLLLVNETVVTYNYDFKLRYFNPITLTLITAVDAPNNGFVNGATVHTDGLNLFYIYSYYPTYSVMLYTSQGEPIWRFPLTSSFVSFAGNSQTNNGLIYISTTETLIQINTFESTSTNVVSSSIPLNTSTIGVSGNYNMIALDLNSNLYFTYFANTEINIVAYDTSMKQTFSYSFGDTTSFAYSDIPHLIFIIEDGMMCGYQNSNLYAYQCHSNPLITTETIISIIILITTLIVAIFLALKHRAFGDDPEGWNCRKIPEVIGTLITISGIILITLLVCITNYKLLVVIDENTDVFTTDLQTFAYTYIKPCYPSSSPMGMELCSCSDPSSQFSTGSCIDADCTNSNQLYSCSSVLETYCACSNALYVYDCKCVYNVDGSCSASYNTTSTINPTANSQWSECQNQYYLPTLMLKISFVVMILSAAILVIANLLQFLLKFDNPLLDLLITIFSLLFSLLSTIVLSIGVFDLSSSSSTNCLQDLLNDLPGCILFDQSTLMQQQETGYAYLQYAYITLASGPVMFFISSLPDLLSIYSFCKKDDKSEYSAAFRRLCCCCCGRSYSYDSIN